MKIERMNKGSWGKVRAFFDVMTEEGFTMKGFRIIEGINGLFIAMPSQKGKEDEYFDTIYAAPELKEELSQLALQQYGMQNDSPDNFSFPNNQENTTQSNNEAASGNGAAPQTGPQLTESMGANEPVTSDDDIPF